jgi:hypothetical protein
MNKLTDLVVNPSGLDSMANYLGEIPDPQWLVVMTRNRDSDILTESNWDTALTELGGELENEVEIFRFGHWACGWWEVLCVRDKGTKHNIGQDIVDRIESYPVLDEDDYSQRENEEANRVWADCYDTRERIEYIRDHRDQFDFHDFKDLLSCVRGEYFPGYASEIIY